MSPDTDQLMIGGVLAILLIDRAYAFVRFVLTKYKANGTAGERPVEYWQRQNEEAAARAFAPLAQRLLDRMDVMNTTLNESLRSLRASHHEMRNALQILVGRLDR